MDLPAELIQNVTERLPRSDLKQLRLVCKQLAEHVVPCLFNTAFLSRDPFDIDATESMLKYHSASIRTLIVCPLKYRLLSRESYTGHVSGARYRLLGRLPWRSRYDQHLTLGYKQHRKLQESSTRESSRIHFWKLLKRTIGISSIRKVVITRRHHNAFMVGRELQRYCAWKSCSIPDDKHTMFRLSPQQNDERFSCPNLSRLLSTLAIGSGTQLTEVIMERQDFSMRMNTFGSITRYTTQIGIFMASLTKLHLAIDCNNGRTILRRGILRGYLSLAQSLECLFLKFDRYEAYGSNAVGSAFHHTLFDCRLPKLQVLALEGIHMVGNELLPFLKDSSELKHLVIEYCHLEAYQWRELVEKIKIETRLQTLYLNYLLSTYTFHLQTSGYVDYRDDAGSYIFSHESQLFTVEEMAQWMEEYVLPPYRNQLRLWPSKFEDYYNTYL